MSEEKEMHRRALMRLAFGVGLLVMMTLALTGCGGGGGSAQKEEAEARPLPEDHEALRPGEYRTEEFKPSASFRVGKNWSTSPPEGSDNLELEYGETGGLAFSNVQKVFEPTRTSTTEVVDAPEDLVGWFKQHPYVQVDKPQPITVGGAKGIEFDVALEEDLPGDHNSPCGTYCVDIFSQTTGDLTLYEGDKVHAIVLEDVKGETVYLDYRGLATDFDKVEPEAQRLVGSIKWTGS